MERATTSEQKNNVALTLRQETFRKIKRYKYLYLLLLIPMIHLILFRYIPIFGNIIAFRKYQPAGSMFGTGWVGFKNFEMFLGDPTFWKVFTNTIVLSIESIIITFPLPIIYAILLNELRGQRFKKAVQTISYLPHFISVIIIVGMVSEFLSPSSGIVNMIIKKLGGDPVFFVVEPAYFRTIYIGTSIWQGLGWSSIIYLAALTNIDVGLYEAADIDGAGRFKKIWHITLPGISPTVVTLFIITVGQIMGISFGKVLLLQNGGNMEVAEVIGTYTYKMGLINSNYSYSAAVGLFEGAIGVILVSSANFISKRLSDTALW